MPIPPPKIMTLALVFRDEKVLLGWKKTGFGAGRWNGFGGKVEPGELVINAAKRELEEEAGIRAHSLIPHGIITYITLVPDKAPIEMHLFRTEQFEGEPHESTEMSPAWFDVSNVPLYQMWHDDQFWFPHVLNGRVIEATFWMDDNDQVKEHTIHQIV